MSNDKVDTIDDTANDSTNNNAIDDPISILTTRARDLSLAISNPKTLATKLRETLIDTVGPQKASTFHLSISYNSETNLANITISQVTPSFTGMITADPLTHNLSAGASWQRTVNGWEIGVGAVVTVGRIKPNNNGTGQDSSEWDVSSIPTTLTPLQAPTGSSVKAQFTVTISR